MAFFVSAALLPFFNLTLKSFAIKATARLTTSHAIGSQHRIRRWWRDQSGLPVPWSSFHSSCTPVQLQAASLHTLCVVPMPRGEIHFCFQGLLLVQSFQHVPLTTSGILFLSSLHSLHWYKLIFRHLPHDNTYTFCYQPNSCL